jgi:hypothetical protein
VIRLAGSEDTDEEDLAAIRAISVPTNTTIDGNANDAVNILRCEVPPGLREYAMEKKAGAFEVRGERPSSCRHITAAPR